jgi:hypothetical protein
VVVARVYEGDYYHGVVEVVAVALVDIVVSVVILGTCDDCC